MLFAACTVGSMSGYAQKITGVVFERAEGKQLPLAGANVYWLGVDKGTSTRDNGLFMIDRVAGYDKLVISFVGFKPDTLSVGAVNYLQVELQPDATLQEITVQGWRSTSHIDHSSALNKIVMDERELFKAACCNLSESFETNPSVDVAFSDAITGTRQIQMLGLAGPNTAITVENMPTMRGVASSQGIQLLPGTWIDAVQVTKGTGSVVNGSESISGQINVELKKPEESDRLLLNGYVNNSGRLEGNAVLTLPVGKKWASTLLLHGSARPLQMDQNQDGFLDFPTGSQSNIINRWVYFPGNGWLGQFAFKYLNDEKLGGQVNFDPETDKFTNNRFGFNIGTERWEWTGKLGYQFAGKPYKSVGLQVATWQHRHNSYFGYTLHDALERSLYANLIYQSIIGDTKHKFKTGISFKADQVDEQLGSALFSGPALDFGRREIVPGAFGEYTYDNLETFSVIVGARVDQHNLFGTLFAPRLHAKYHIHESATLRASAGRGIRLANLITENTGFLASSRVLILLNQQTANAYGFVPDKAWNYGLGLNKEFTLNYRPGNFTIEYYYTDFQNQVVVDYDADPQRIKFYTLTGRSFSHSAQAQIDYQLVRRFDLRLAYRWLDVQTDYLQGRLQRPLIARSRAFANLAYKTKKNWSFDFTVQRLGQQRIPSTAANPVDYQMEGVAPAYVLMNSQVTKDFSETWSAYVGVENLGNFRLSNPIVGAADPFGPYFDSSLVWGPVFGRMAYAGFRYRFK